MRQSSITDWKPGDKGITSDGHIVTVESIAKESRMVKIVEPLDKQLYIPAHGEIEKLPSPVYKYTSPYRPLPMNYIPEGVNFLYDYSTIGAWTPATIYAFDKPLPDNQVKQWDLEKV